MFTLLSGGIVDLASLTLLSNIAKNGKLAAVPVTIALSILVSRPCVNLVQARGVHCASPQPQTRP